MTETPIDPRLPAAQDCVTRILIDRRAAETPDKVYAVFPDGERWTYARLRAEVRQAAAGLAALGVKQDDHVVSWLPNGQDALRTWYAINYLGAVYVPINTAYRGGLLAHVIENSDAELIVAHRDLAPRLEDVPTARLKTLVRVAGDASPCAGLTAHGADALAPRDAEPPELARPLQPWDVQSIIYTSGTTGPSKGVLSSYAHLTATGEALPLGPEDRYMANLPLFHVGGTLPCHTMLARGGSVSMIESFRTETFWDMIRDTETTFVILLGVMAQFLAKQPPSPGDADNPLRLVCLIPYDFDATDFSARFGVQVMSLFNMTEVSVPIVTGLDPTIVHAAGRPRAGIEARIVDDNDCEVDVNVAGELIVRADAPWVLNSGYYKNPEATAKAWRNGWFHTGDGFRRDADGNFFFVDRIKDAIRRRGENISSYEVEAEALAHPDVNECAAVAVRSEVSEDEVMIVVAPAPGRSLDPAALLEFLVPRMAHFMLPRYIRVVEALPKTPTAKVRKLELRETGVTRDTWDREAAGVRVRREKIGG